MASVCAGGRLSMSDLADYSSKWSPSVQTVLHSINLTVHSAPPPGSGAVLGAVLNIMDQFSDHQVHRSLYCIIVLKVLLLLSNVRYYGSLSKYSIANSHIVLKVLLLLSNV